MRGISLVSNNIANSNTTAFKKSYSNFSDIYSKNISDDPKGFSGMGKRKSFIFTWKTTPLPRAPRGGDFDPSLKNMVFP